MVTAYYIPNGVKNLQSLFPLIDFDNIQRYYVEVKDTAGAIIATSPINEIGGCCDDDKVRVHFLNACGTIDAINFKLLTEEQETKSQSYKRPVQYPLDKTLHSGQRFDVKSNLSYFLCTTDYTEADKDWLTELFESPLSWMEWAGTQGQSDSYLPIVIVDKKFEKVKEEDRFIYEVKIEFKFSHDRVTIRN